MALGARVACAGADGGGDWSLRFHSAHRLFCARVRRPAGVPRPGCSSRGFGVRDGASGPGPPMDVVIWLFPFRTHHVNRQLCGRS